MARTKKVANVTISAINEAIDNVKHLSMKDVLNTMPTAKFYEAEIIEKRAVDCRKIAKLTYEFARQFDALDDEDVTEAMRYALLRSAKESANFAIVAMPQFSASHHLSERECRRISSCRASWQQL